MGKTTGLLKQTIPVLIVAAFTLWQLLPLPLQAASPTSIRVVTDDNYPPYAFRDETGALKGIIIDQWKLWEQKTRIPVKVTGMDWGEAQRRMLAGEFDVIDTIFRNEKRERLYDFTKPYARLEVPLFFNADISGIRGPDDARGFLVAAKEGDAVVDYLHQHGVTYLKTYPSYEKLIQAARAGKVKVFAADKPPALYFLYKYGIQNQFRETAPMYFGEFHRAVLKGNHTVLSLVESGFAAISAAEYRDIDERWMGTPVLGTVPVRKIVLAIASAATLLTILLLWNVFLKSVVKKRTRELSESKQHFQMIFDSVNDAILIHDLATGEILDVNMRMCEMYGVTRAEALRLTVGDLSSGVPPYGREEARDWLRRATEGKPQLFEWHARHKDGHLFWVEVSMRRALIGREDAILVTVRDITERKEAEESLQRSEAKYREFVEGTSDLVTQVDAEGRFLFVNRNAETYFGCPAAACVGRTAFGFVHPDDQARTMAAFQSWVRSGIRSTTFENRQVSLTGEVYDMLWTINLNYDDDNNLKQVNAIARDMTEQRRLLNEQIKNQKMESLGVLAGGIAHDFNNILTGIMGNISLAKLRLNDPLKACGALEGAERASVRAAELARQLLTFAKGGQPVKKVISLRQVVTEAASLVLHGSKVKSVVDIPDTVDAIEADEGQISQVLHNIIINAIQAMPDGGILTVAARNETLDCGNDLALPPGSYVCLSLADQGCGIPDDVQEKIFDPYFSTKATGSGLGLATVHSIVAKHNGHIGVTSEVGKGTTFTLYLPSIGEDYSHYAGEVVETASGDSRGGTVLVMDDDEVILELASAMLREIGYQAVTCRDGEEAVERYQAAKRAGAPFTAVIMDLTIPGGMGGKEAGRMILDIDPDARLIVSSGYSNDPIVSQYKAYGFKGAIAKPYRIGDLASLMAKLHE